MNSEANSCVKLQHSYTIRFVVKYGKPFVPHFSVNLKLMVTHIVMLNLIIKRLCNTVNVILMIKFNKLLFNLELSFIYEQLRVVPIIFIFSMGTSYVQLQWKQEIQVKQKPMLWAGRTVTR